MQVWQKVSHYAIVSQANLAVTFFFFFFVQLHLVPCAYVYIDASMCVVGVFECLGFGYSFGVRWPFGPAFVFLWNLQHPWILTSSSCCFCLRGEPSGGLIGRKTPLVKVQMATWSMSSWQVGPTGPEGALSVNCCLLSPVFGATWLPSSFYLMGPPSVNQRLQTLSSLCTLNRA